MVLILMVVRSILMRLGRNPKAAAVVAASAEAVVVAVRVAVVVADLASAASPAGKAHRKLGSTAAGA
jgi:hypothetical protein